MDKCLLPFLIDTHSKRVRHFFTIHSFFLSRSLCSSNYDMGYNFFLPSYEKPSCTKQSILICVFELLLRTDIAHAYIHELEHTHIDTDQRLLDVLLRVSLIEKALSSLKVTCTSMAFCAKACSTLCVCRLVLRYIYDRIRTKILNAFERFISVSVRSTGSILSHVLLHNTKPKTGVIFCFLLHTFSFVQV